MRIFGLIGQSIEHSFSPAYFAQKFEKEGIQDAAYQLFPLAAIKELPQLLAYKTISGLNVTIPYKQAVIPYLDRCTDAAKAIAAVNTIAFEDGQLIGHNTDVYGFEQSLRPLLTKKHLTSKALVLGTGGASKAVCYVLQQLGITYHLVSRTPSKNQLSYAAINRDCVKQHLLIINTTPLGMSPNTEASPRLPYSNLGSEHLLYDLVYNPLETSFLTKGRAQGTIIKNGLEMLHLQADKAWEIWKASF